MLGIEPRLCAHQTDKLGYTPSAVYIFLNIVFKYEDRLRDIHTVKQDQILGSALDHRISIKRFFLPNSHTVHVSQRNEVIFFLCRKVCLWQKWDKNLVFLSPKLLPLSSITLSPSMPTTAPNIISVLVGGEGQWGPCGSCPLLLFYPRTPSRTSVTEWLFKVSLGLRSSSLLQAVWFKPDYQSPNIQTPLISVKHCPRQ